VLLAVACAAGQTTQGLITGRIVDLAGAAMPGATVRFERLDVESGAVVEVGFAPSTAGGFYSLAALTPGMYRLRVTREDYQPQEVSELELPVAARLEANFSLRRLAEIWRSETEVEVGTGPAAAIVSYYAADVEQLRFAAIQVVPGETTNRAATLSYVLDAGTIGAAPLNGRDLYSALALLPGVASDNSTGRGLGLAVNGTRPSSSNFLLDGVENNNYLISGPLTTLSPEAAQEYRISTSNYSAEYGRAAGYIANVVTRAGSGAWHGIGYANVKNEALNANLFQDNWRGLRIRPLKEAQWGARVGGPLIRNRLFVSSAFERLRSRTRQQPADFLAPAPGAIGLTRNGSTARRLLTEFPTPAMDRGNGLVSILTAEPSVSLDRWLGLARLDASALSGRLRLMGRASASRPSQPDFIWYPYPQFRSELKHPAQSIAVNGVLTLSARWVAEGRAGWSRDDLGWNRPHPEIPTLSVIDLGPDGTAGPVLLPGSPAAYEYRNAGTNREWTGSFLFVAGRHLLKTGGGALARQSSGRLTFARDALYEFDGIGAFLVFNQPASLRLAVDRAALPAVRTPRYDRSYLYRQYQAFVQDSFRAAAGLTLDFGLRYEHFGSPAIIGSEKDMVVRLGSGRSLAERVASANLSMPPAGAQTLYTGANGGVAGRFGLSYSPGRHSSTVLSGAYGIFYDRPFDNLWQNHRNNNLTLERFDYLGAPDAYLPVTPSLSLYDGQAVAGDFPAAVLFDPHLKTGYAQSWFAGVERRIRSALSLAVNGSGSLGRRLITTDIINRLPGPFAQVQQVSYRAGQGRSSYHALSARALWRSGSGSFLAAYTWSHSIDNQSDPLALDFFDLSFTSLTRRTEDSRARAAFTRESQSHADRGNSDFDQRHTFTFFAYRELPRFGPVPGSWTVGATGAIRAGFPYSVLAGDTVSILNRRADIIGSNPTTDAPVPGGRLLLNRRAFANPPGQEAGNSGRNSFRGPGIYSFDVSLARTFAIRRLGESARLTVRADAYNVLNHANLGQPVTSLQSADFGQAQFGRRGAQSSFPALSPLDETARQIQIIVRFEF
jgi:hypothetical protein